MKVFRGVPTLDFQEFLKENSKNFLKYGFGGLHWGIWKIFDGYLEESKRGGINNFKVIRQRLKSRSNF